MSDVLATVVAWLLTGGITIQAMKSWLIAVRYRNLLSLGLSETFNILVAQSLFSIFLYTFHLLKMVSLYCLLLFFHSASPLIRKELVSLVNIVAN